MEKMFEKRCFYCNSVLNHEATEMASDRFDIPEGEDFQIDYFVCPECGKHFEVDFPTQN